MRTPDEPLYDEPQVPSYTLPDPLIFADGTPVTDPDDWLSLRHPELLARFEHHVYGRAPGRPEELRFEVESRVDDALNGNAIRKEIAIHLSNQPNSPLMRLLLYLPAEITGPVPVFVGLNFFGNHTIDPDPGITLSNQWMRPSPEKGIENNRATEASRGTATSRWPVDRILKRHYGLATIYCGDLDPDYDDGFHNGVHALYERNDRRGDAWGTIAAWAWGLSRTMDYFEIDTDVDAQNVAVMGHSRLGKTALWVGATDPRFALVISNDSGCGGAALSRRRFGETVKRINTTFPHWFCSNFKRYNDREDALPVDQHMLIALIAPRPVYVASAEDDLWADPRGEFLAAQAASPVYRLLDTEGLPVEAVPSVGDAVHGRIGYHVRPGGHDVTNYDWDQYMNFADLHLLR
jgi:hypothetical protein